MGMYTEFKFHAKLHPDIPTSVILVLENLMNWTESLSGYANHEFFSCPRKFALFSGTDAVTDVEQPKLQKWDHGYFLKIHSSFKNYDSEIQKFCDWISPWIYEFDGTSIGFKHYEEYSKPTELIFQNGKIVEMEPEGDQDDWYY